jgi:hypothetical protein
VEDLQVLEQGVGGFEAGAPALPVEQFGLHTSPQNESIVVLSQHSPWPALGLGLMDPPCGLAGAGWAGDEEAGHDPP